MNVYLLSGKDTFRLERNLQGLLEKYGVVRDNVIKVDGSSKKFRIESALMQCDSYSLFAENERKAVIITDPFFLNASAKGSSAKKSAKDDERQQRIDALSKYLNHPSRDTLLVFYCHGFAADTRKKEYKLLSDYKVNIVSFKEMTEREVNDEIDRQLKEKGYHLTRDALRELISDLSLVLLIKWIFMVRRTWN